MRLIDADAYAAELWEMRQNYQMLDDTQTADKIMYGLYRAEQALKDARPSTPCLWCAAANASISKTVCATTQTHMTMKRLAGTQRQIGSARTEKERMQRSEA